MRVQHLIIIIRVISKRTHCNTSRQRFFSLGAGIRLLAPFKNAHLWELHLPGQVCKGPLRVSQPMKQYQQVLVDAIAGGDILPGQIGEGRGQAAGGDCQPGCSRRGRCSTRRTVFE
jgi:hypothetical protein